MPVDLPALGDTDWYDWAADIHAKADGAIQTTGIDPTPITAADFGVAVPARCRVYSLNAAQTVASGAYPVYLDTTTTEYNDDAALFTVDHTNNRVTVTQAGLYLVTWEVSFAAAALGERSAFLSKNGGNAIRVAGGVQTANLYTAYRSVPVRFAANDYIQVIVYVEGATVTVRSAEVFHSGFELVRIGL